MTRMMRLSPEQYDAMLKHKGKSFISPPVAAPRKVESKYKARSVGGYASTKEAKRAQELKFLETSGKIRELREQVKYELIGSQRDPLTLRLIERPCSYYADFDYEEQQNNGTWQHIVEDTKGLKKGSAYANFVIKRKLMLKVHGIRVRET